MHVDILQNHQNWQQQNCWDVQRFQNKCIMPYDAVRAIVNMWYGKPWSLLSSDELHHNRYRIPANQMSAWPVKNALGHKAHNMFVNFHRRLWDVTQTQKRGRLITEKENLMLNQTNARRVNGCRIAEKIMGRRTKDVIIRT